jgi:hypothetical protein
MVQMELASFCASFCSLNYISDKTRSLSEKRKGDDAEYDLRMSFSGLDSNEDSATKR